RREMITRGPRGAESNSGAWNQLAPRVDQLRARAGISESIAVGRISNPSDRCRTDWKSVLRPTVQIIPAQLLTPVADGAPEFVRVEVVVVQRHRVLEAVVAIILDLLAAFVV